MLTKETKKHLLAILIVAIALAVTAGVRICAIVILAIFCAGMLLITSVWLIGFLLVAVLEHSVSYAWNYLHPVKMLRECFCEQEIKS